MDLVRPAAVRYIKLGPGGDWFDRCIQDGTMEFGHHPVPHAVALAEGREGLELLFEELGRTQGKAKDFAREVHDFYNLGSDTLWITIGAGRLWWGFAEPDVSPMDEPGRGARLRRIRGGWRDTDLAGVPLRLDGLSTRLTKVAAYRQTLCRVEAEDYLVRRINAEPGPGVEAAQAARASMIASARALIEGLSWRDFEVMVDLIFAGSGWRRVSAVGGSDQADTDLILEQPATGERAFVQIKSRASPAVLADYIARYRASEGYQRLFFICHSPVGVLAAPEAPDVRIWLGDRLAEQAVKAGLFDWLIEKSR